MRPNLEEWTIVLVGGWNPKIFSPGWVAGRLFGVKDSQTVKIEAGIGPGVQFLKYYFKGALIIPRDDRLILGLATPMDDQLERIEKLACRVLELLPETPLTAVGVNFGFVEDDVPQDLSGIFEIADRQQLASTDYVVANRTELHRQLARNKGGVLNLKQVFAPPNVEITMNYHLGTDQWKEAKTFLDGEVIRMREESLKFLNTMYRLSLDEQVEEAIANVD